MNIYKLTPVENRGTHYYKREDEFVINNVCGGKARVVYELVKNGINNGVRDFVSCGSRDSRQCEVVAKICEYFGVKSHLFMPSGENTDITDSICATKGVAMHRIKVGYNNVLISQSKRYSQECNYFYIPFGLDCHAAIDINMHQVQNIPQDIKRIVIPCGGGINMLAVIKGLEYYGMYDKEVVGVIVGKDPKAVFRKYIQNDIFSTTKTKYAFEHYPFDYHTRPKDIRIDGVILDEVYEAKCIPFLQDGDLLWIVGKKL